MDCTTVHDECALANWLRPLCRIKSVQHDHYLPLFSSSSLSSSSCSSSSLSSSSCSSSWSFSSCSSSLLSSCSSSSLSSSVIIEIDNIMKAHALRYQTQNYTSQHVFQSIFTHLRPRQHRPPPLPPRRLPQPLPPPAPMIKVHNIIIRLK